MKILIVEDDVSSLKVLRLSLERLGNEVVEAKDGKEAWVRFNEGPFRIVVSDWMMPELDGLDLCRKMRARPQTDYTYFILLTARTGKENYTEAMDAGIDDFLNKPLDREELYFRIRVADRILGFTTRIQQLESLLHICSYCKKISDVEKSWNNIESYISKRTTTSFSHSICPECYDAHVKPMLEQYRIKSHREHF